MLGKGTRLYTSKKSPRRAISWWFQNPEVASTTTFQTVEYPQIRWYWGIFRTINVQMREDLVKLQTTAKDTLICTLNERILTKQGWKTVEELILDLKSHTILNRIQLCTLRGNFPMHPCLDSVYEIGYGECYELLTDSPHPLRAENFLVGGSNEL